MLQNSFALLPEYLDTVNISQHAGGDWPQINRPDVEFEHVR